MRKQTKMHTQQMGKHRAKGFRGLLVIFPFACLCVSFPVASAGQDEMKPSQAKPKPRLKSQSEREAKPSGATEKMPLAGMAIIIRYWEY